ncbi:MAG: hypothetical protein U1F98_03535 [Verrucomicrobiota bacterium]
MKTIVCLLVLAGSLGSSRGAVADTNSDRPIPPLDVITARAVEAAQAGEANDQAYRRNYYYTWNRVTWFRNGDGELKKTEQKQGTNDPARKKNRPAKSQPAAATQAARPDSSRTHGHAVDKKELMNPELLDRFTFEVQGRELLNGRSAIVIDFKPKPGKLPENGLRDKFVNRAAGRIWLDEEEFQLVKADMHLTSPVDVLGGIVGTVWKFNCTINRERTADGLWFMRSTSWHLDCREVVFHRIIDFREQTSGQRKIETKPAGADPEETPQG